MSNGFLPISKEDMKEQGISQLDFVYVCGDAYVDHPSFGHAIISRVLQSHGYTVGIIAQPDWTKSESINILGEPRLGFLVSAGNMDSMVNHYSVSKKRRTTDAFTPGGVMGKRPDYATIVYCNLIRQTYKKKPIIIPTCIIWLCVPFVKVLNPVTIKALQDNHNCNNSKIIKELNIVPTDISTTFENTIKWFVNNKTKFI